MDISQLSNKIITFIFSTFLGLLLSSSTRQDEAINRKLARTNTTNHSQLFSLQKETPYKEEEIIPPAYFSINNKKNSNTHLSKITFSNIMIKNYILTKGLNAVSLAEFLQLKSKPKIIKTYGNNVLFYADKTKTYNVFYNNENNSFGILTGEFSVSLSALGVKNLSDPSLPSQIESIEKVTKSKLLTFLPKKQIAVFSTVQIESTEQELFAENMLNSLDNLQLNPPPTPMLRSAYYRAK